MHEALFYNKLPQNRVACYLCNHKCNIDENCFGICGTRKNIAGNLYSFNYGKVVAANIDPIEKKPLFHFLAASASYSIACSGCNFSCGFCQNWQISQFKEAAQLNVKNIIVPAEKIVEAALEAKCPSISYTYTEPTIYFEYAYECSQLASAKNIKNVFVTNGYMSKEALKRIVPYLQAANIDLKSFSDSFYKDICKAKLKPVLENIQLMKQLGVWVEITTLLIPGRNDSFKELGDIAKFIFSVDKNIPWHVSKFHPDYKFDNHQDYSSENIFSEARKIGYEAGLNFVYLGNVCIPEAEATYCPACKKELIKREGFWVKENNLLIGKCKFCKEEIAGIWQ